MVPALKYLPAVTLLLLPSVAYAQVPTDLSLPLQQGAQCQYTESSVYHDYRVDDTRMVTIDSQLWNSQFYLYVQQDPTGSDPEPFNRLACLIDTNLYESLEVEFGIADDQINREPTATVNFFQNGSIVRPYTNIPVGQIFYDEIDLEASGGVSRFTIEMRCTGRGNCTVDFLRAQLIASERNIVPPQGSAPSSLPSSQQSAQEEPSQPPQQGNSVSDVLRPITDFIETIDGLFD
jgi:hypothetical protein